MALPASHRAIPLDRCADGCRFCLPLPLPQQQPAAMTAALAASSTLVVDYDALTRGGPQLLRAERRPSLVNSGEVALGRRAAAAAAAAAGREEVCRGAVWLGMVLRVAMG